MSNRITLDDLKQFAHLKQAEAAVELGISKTTLKRIIQDYGIRRWPYRHLAAIEAKKEHLRQELSIDTPQSKWEFINRRISRLEDERQLAIAQMGRNHSTARTVRVHLPSLHESLQRAGTRDIPSLSLQQLEETKESTRRK